MTHLLLRFLIIVFALLLAAKIVPGIAVASLSTAVVVALVLGLLNITLRPLLLLLTLPVTILTLGLFIFILNALIFWLAGAFVPGFSVAGFVPAFLGALLVSVISWIAHRFLK